IVYIYNMSKQIIEIKNLTYSYPDGTIALKNINLNVFEGESIGIIGPNGAGKSTLLLHLNGILKGSGDVRILDFKVEEKNLPEIRSKVGLVFQDPDNQLFMPSVFDDVAFGPINMKLPKEEIVTAVHKSLEKVDMLASIDRLSHHLSFGEKKRISIATVLSMNPEVLVLDEPSSNLDPKHRRDLIELMKNLKLTKIIASHDLDLILEVCSRVILLDKGELIESGDVNSILSNKSLLEGHSLEMPNSLFLSHKSS
ncbi:MAG: ABC transporter ATP-binding protein, partial [Candidatus Firestonebacteria bacterium]